MSKLGYLALAILSLLVAVIQLRFIFMPVEMASPDMVHHLGEIAGVFWLHVVGATLALALGVPQFLPELRARRPRIHRWTGRGYVVTAMLGALAGFGLAVNANGGAVTQIGFATLAAAWAFATGLAYLHARGGRYEVHRQWMIRSYALAFAAVTLRLQVPVWANLLATDYTGVLPIIAWSSWLPNLVVAEWLIRSSTKPVPAVAR